MRIYEILYWNNEPAEENRSEPQLDPFPAPFSDDPTKLANAFTRSGLVKSFWNLNGLGAQPSAAAPPDAGTEVIPSGTLEPTTTASWQAEPVETERPVGQHRYFRFSCKCFSSSRCPRVTPNSFSRKVPGR
jgi:hypothetical protein